MVLDRLEQADRYASLHPGLAAGFYFLRRVMTEGAAPGRFELDGERLFAIVARDEGRGRGAAKLESHRRYIDIQMPLPLVAEEDASGLPSPSMSADEVIGWRAVADCRDVETPYDEARDIAFYRDAPQTWLTLSPGMFAVFFPEDAHAPLAGQGSVLKAIVKVAVNW
jgi:beta-galactosidase beta subunit